MRRIWIAACVALALASLGALTAPLAHAYAPDGSQGWYWQMPQPAGTLDDVTFASPSDVWAVGVGGTILHSTDAGASWSSQQSGTFVDLQSVGFPDLQHGLTCGQSSSGASVVLGTTDGGANWVDHTPSGLSDPLTNVSFPDAQHGWIGTIDGHILRTSDGGDLWKTSRVGSARGALEVDFVDAGHGWAADRADGILWYSSDGGTSWSAVHRFGSPSAEMLTIDFTSRSQGWACILSGSSGTTASTVLVTSDGGRAWRTVKVPGDQVILALHASSSSTACFAGAAFSANAPELSERVESTLCRTTDGGSSWSSQRVGSTVEPWALGGNGESFCAVGRGVLTAADGGPWLAASSGQGYELMDGVVVSGSDLWAVDEAGALLHSSDGATWAEQPAPIRWAQQLSGVSFPDTDDGWLVGSASAFGGGGVILHTSDGGTTWAPQSSSLGGELIGVQFVDDTEGWAISDDPYGDGTGAMTGIERTTDGGSGWSPQYVPNNPGLTTLSFIDHSLGWAGGSYDDQSGGIFAAVYKTTDGGQTWTQKDLPGGAQNISGLQFLDASDGWAVAEDYSSRTATNGLLQTTDGGSSWAKDSSLPAAASPTTVHFLDGNDGWVAGDGVWATTDGGTTWSEVAGNSDVYALAASDASHVWGFGDGIVSTVDGGGGDSAPPQTLDDADWSWHHGAVTITLSPNDTGGSGLAGTQFSSDGGGTWTSGTSIDVPAPADHANDGLRSFLYRSSDNAGNVEATEICGVGIDTLGPTCGAPKAAVADAGKPVVIRFQANDETSGVARATITIATRGGRTVKRLVSRSGDWSGSPVPYYWLRFTCKLKPGHYRIEVRATDRAGNAQVRMGINVLRVVRRGAPPATHPFWPAGLPDTTQQFGTAATQALSSRAAGPLGQVLRIRSLRERLLR